MSTGSVVLLFVVVAICADLFPLSSAFQWVKDPGTELIQTYPKQKSLVLRWEWSLSGSESVNQAQVRRYKTKDRVYTQKRIGILYSNGVLITEKAYFKLSGQTGTAGGSNGYIELTINDITNQGNNRDNSKVDVFVSNNTYDCDLTIIGSNFKSKSTNLIVYVKPTITTAPKNKYVDRTKTNVVLKCKAYGKPKPKIEWERRSTSGTISSLRGGEELIISKSTGDDFQMSDVGIYTCTVTNNVGHVKASAVVQFTECNAGCSTDDKIAIEMTDLTYSSDYDNPSSAKYKELKDAIEKDCFNQYFKSRKSIYSCVVTNFRKGNQGVVANIKITYPSSTDKPRKPLQTAIETGTFAGQRVKTSFVRPTSPPVSTSQPSTPPVTTRRPSTRPTIKTKFLLRLMLKLLESFKALIDVTTTLIKAHLMSSSDAQFKKREIVSMMNRVQHTSQNIEDSRDFQVIQAKRGVSEIRMRAQNLLQKLDDYIDDDPDFEYRK